MKALPEPDIRYFSKLKAMYLLEKADCIRLKAEGTGFEPVHPLRDTGFRNPRI